MTNFSECDSKCKTKIRCGIGKSIAIGVAGIILILIFLNSMPAVAQSDVAVNDFNVKYIDYDASSNSYRAQVNISLTAQGKMKYVEEYYNLNANNNPQYRGMQTYYDNLMMDEDENGLFNSSFEILRPSFYFASDRPVVKAIILFDNKRIFEMWLGKDRNNVIDNTEDEDSYETTASNNIEKHEIRENRIYTDRATAFKFNTIGVIDEIDVLGKMNIDISINIDVLKAVPDNSYGPGETVYKYLQISSSDDIKELGGIFKVENSWIKDNKIQLIWMIKWNPNIKAWEGFPTSFIKKDDSYMYFAFNNSEPGLHAIAGVQAEQTPIPTANTSANANNNTLITSWPNTSSPAGIGTPSETIKPVFDDKISFGEPIIATTINTINSIKITASNILDSYSVPIIFLLLIFGLGVISGHFISKKRGKQNEKQ